jgi:hypothetical protein
LTYSSNRWTDFPGYILGVTQEIWEGRGIHTLRAAYAPDIPVRTPMGVRRGNEGVIADTMSTLHEFPDRELLGEDVIWSETDGHFLSSHRILSRATHSRDGAFGPATGRRWTARVIADCAARDDVIDDEWLVRDYGGIVRQLGQEPRNVAAGIIAREGGPERAARPFAPERDVEGPYCGTGNSSEWGERYAATLTRITQADFAHVRSEYDRAVVAEHAGGATHIGREEVTGFWLGLRASFPSATFRVHHRIGMEGDMMSPRAAIRWSLDGAHDGWGAFGRPTGARVHVMGMAHAEWGPWGLRREYALHDEVAIWKQILLHEGAEGPP